MNLNPLSIRYNYHAALWHGRWRRASFVEGLHKLAARDEQSTTDALPIDVFSMIGRSMLPEAVTCLRSLIRYAGRPESLILVSDGSLIDHDFDVLERSLPEAKIVELHEMLASDLPGPVADRLAEHWMVQKQALLMSLPRSRPAMFVDADILFFPGASRLARDLAEFPDQPRYMADIEASFDPRLMHAGDPTEPPLNSGMLYFPRAIDWTLAVERFASLQSESELAFTDQTMSHLAFHANGAIPFPTKYYALQIDDQFEYGDRYAHEPEMVCRHYTRTIRHKLWLRNVS